MRQGLFGLAQVQQAQAAAGVGLPQTRIERNRLFKGAPGLVELALAFQGEPEIIVRRGVVRFGLDDLGVAGGGFSPLLLFEAQMAQAGIDLRRLFPARGGAFQFLDGVVQAARRGELHRVSEGAGLGRALGLGLGGGGIAAHQPFYQLVVYKKSVLVILRHIVSLFRMQPRSALCDS